MEITGTKQAFEKMLEERGVYKKLGVTRSVISEYKTSPPSINKMEQMLLKYGAAVIQEKKWELPG